MIKLNAPVIIPSFGIAQGDKIFGLESREMSYSPADYALFIDCLRYALRKTDSFSLLHESMLSHFITEVLELGNGVTFVINMVTPNEKHLAIKKTKRMTWEKMYKNHDCGIGAVFIGNKNVQLRKALKLAGELANIRILELGHCEMCEASESIMKIKGHTRCCTIKKSA